MAEGYLRIWVRGADDVADGFLARWDQEWFDNHVGEGTVEYIGSARMGHESAVPSKDRCQILLGLRGDEENIRLADSRLQEEHEGRSEVVMATDIFVSRTAPQEIFPLVPGEQDQEGWGEEQE